MILNFQHIKMETRLGCSRPTRLGTRRRRPHPAAADPAAGVPSAGRRPSAHSLDTEKLLATSVADWLESHKTEFDHRREQVSLQRLLNSTIYRLWHSYAEIGDETTALKWEKQWVQIHNCQKEWIGYKAACCEGRTRAIAVPVGCN